MGRFCKVRPPHGPGLLQISVEELHRNLVVKVNKDAVMKIAVAGDLFQLDRGLYHLNLTVGGIPFKEKDLVQPVSTVLSRGVGAQAPAEDRRGRGLPCFALTTLRQRFPGCTMCPCETRLSFHLKR